MSKLRIIFDTNVLISSIAFPNSTPYKALHKAIKEGALVFSAETIDEFKQVLFRPKFDKYIDLKLRQAFLLEILTSSLIVKASPCKTICRDINDQKFLETLQAGEVDFLVSGDKDLLVLEKVDDCTIISPIDFLRDNAIN